TRISDMLQQRLVTGSGHPLRDLQRDVSDESVADDHVRPSVEDVSTLYVPDEIQRAGFKELQGFLGELVALRVFFPDTEQADPGARLSEQVLAVLIAHEGELLNVLGCAIHVGAG